MCAFVSVLHLFYIDARSTIVLVLFYTKLGRYAKRPFPLSWRQRMTGEREMQQAKQADEGQQEADEVPAAPEAEHDSDCWRYSRCWCFAEEDQHNGRGDR